MKKRNWGYRIARKIFNIIPHALLGTGRSWQWLRYYPAVLPDYHCFNEWNQCAESDEWTDHDTYQSYVDQNDLSSEEGWLLLHKDCFYWKSPPKLTIVIPVYNTDVKVLYECVLSVRVQAYPYWQLILVDDGSSNVDTCQFLNSGVCADPRIQVYFSEKNEGISKTTNIAIDKADGDYVVFLDHDDRLALDALYLIAGEIKKNSNVDIIYTDRDMISPEGKRYQHLFKPDWSPETLLSGNYIFHLMCYKRSLLISLGGYRSDMDGSQDYDLILRATELKPIVRHIKKTLYHWRQYSDSIALDSNIKDYVFTSGLKAINQALQRRGIDGYATEIHNMWRGNYQINFKTSNIQPVEIVIFDSTLSNQTYVQQINQAINENNSKQPFIAILERGVKPATCNDIYHLVSWLKMEGVGLASGKIITTENRIEYAGATYSKDGEFLTPYQGFSITEHGYMGVTQVVRNVSAPHPFCVIIRREVWQQLNGLNHQYHGVYALFDMALRALAMNWRCVSVPDAKFISKEAYLLESYLTVDKSLFFKNWQQWLDQGDPYYNSHFVRDSQEWMYHLAYNKNN